MADTRGVFVQPALYEAFGLTVVEAMSSGLPTGPSDVQLPSAVLVRTWRRQVRLDLACIPNFELAFRVRYPPELLISRARSSTGTGRCS